MDNPEDARALSRSNRGGRSLWFIAELVVIVAGVLIALAIDEWRGKIEDATLEREYLQQLIDDLRATEDEIEKADRVNVAWENAATQLVEAFEQGKGVQLQTVRQWLSLIKNIDNPVPVLAAADALVATGDLRLLANPAKSKVARYLSRSRDYWLVPLYQIEAEHRDLHFRLTVLAQSHGISPEGVGGLSQDPAIAATSTGIVAFFADSQAYSIAVGLAEARGAMARCRSAMAHEAATLRESLEPLIPSK